MNPMSSINRGQTFQTTVGTLSSDPDCYFSCLLRGKYEVASDESQQSHLSYFIDRDPTHFRHILNFLRDGSIVLPLTSNVLVRIVLGAD